MFICCAVQKIPFYLSQINGNDFVSFVFRMMLRRGSSYTNMFYKVNTILSESGIVDKIFQDVISSKYMRSFVAKNAFHGILHPEPSTQASSTLSYTVVVKFCLKVEINSDLVLDRLMNLTGLNSLVSILK